MRQSVANCAKPHSFRNTHWGAAGWELGRKPVMIWPQLATLLLTYPVFLWIVHAPGMLSLLVGFGLLSVIGSLPFTAFYAPFPTIAASKRYQAGASGRDESDAGNCPVKQARSSSLKDPALAGW